MPKKRLSYMVFQRISPPDHQKDLTPEDLAEVLVRRLGLKRKESRAKHAQLLLQLVKYRKENIPLELNKISEILTVSQSQTYEELRKWRSLGLIEFVKIPSGVTFVKGYMLTAPTFNRLMDKAESSAKSFFRKTRRIAKDFDDLLMLEFARKERPEKPAKDDELPEEKEEPVEEEQTEEENAKETEEE